MPLTEAVSFKCQLQKGNRIQVPKLVRLQFKMETTQVLKITVNVVGSFGDSESFYARMSRDGRVTVPCWCLLYCRTKHLEEKVYFPTL